MQEYDSFGPMQIVQISAFGYPSTPLIVRMEVPKVLCFCEFNPSNPTHLAVQSLEIKQDVLMVADLTIRRFNYPT
jgi:hypothetical protein